MYGGRREVKAGFVWIFEGKEPLGIPRRRWEDNIKIVLEYVGRGLD